jgi:hypothetical protein
VQATIGEFADAGAVRLKKRVKIDCLPICLLDQRGRVACGKDVHAVVIREEHLAGVPAGGGREGAAAGSAVPLPSSNCSLSCQTSECAIVIRSHTLEIDIVRCCDRSAQFAMRLVVIVNRFVIPIARKQLSAPSSVRSTCHNITPGVMFGIITDRSRQL